MADRIARDNKHFSLSDAIAMFENEMDDGTDEDDE